MKKLPVGTFLLALLVLFCVSCGVSPEPPADSGDPEYEARTIQIEGLLGLDGAIAEVSVAEMRTLPQHDLEASFKRTTGLFEEFQMSGPLMEEVIRLAGGDMADYAGMGVIGRDNYYCLVSDEVIADTPDLMLALVIDGAAKLDEDNYPARLAVQGQFGPYWVRMVDKIVLYQEIPEKKIANAWIFNALSEGIEPNEYEYYGSLDQAIDLEQVFSRLDYVDSKAFFTMKSSDGFKKNEAMNMVKSRYYIKIDGVDAPTNVAPYIMLGMNVQKIAWFSTNADAAIFPELFMEYLDTKVVKGREGVPLDEVLYEVEVETVKEASFELIGTSGERYRVSGDQLNAAILIPRADGGGEVLWEEGYGYDDIPSLQRIHLVED